MSKDSFDVAAVVGSLRRGSFTRRYVQALQVMAPPALRIEIVPIADLALYDQDVEETPPAAWTAFRERMRRADAILIATPEYNRGVPGALKNAIDVGSRPIKEGVWSGKPTAVVSVSPGALGGYAANHAVRMSLATLDAPILGQPEMYLGRIESALGPDGTLADPGVQKLTAKFLRAFEAWIRRFAPAG